MKIFFKIISSTLFCFSSLAGFPQQSVKEFVKGNTHIVNNISPDSIDYTDLAPIGNAIGDAGIVWLGEQDHGDAPTFLAKTRLIKYLHENKGFNVLAFESDFFALNEGWDKLPKQKGLIDSFLNKNIFPIWSMCNTCSNLFYNYIPHTFAGLKPLHITGFDNQMVLRYTYYNLSKSLDSVIKLLQLPVSGTAAYAEQILPVIDSLWRYYSTNPANDNFFIRCGAYLSTIKKELAGKLPSDNFWVLVVDNLIAENEEYQSKKDYIHSGNVRDKQMAENLRWLAEKKYPGEKIIVWAANEHIAKWGNEEAAGKKAMMIRMGKYFANSNNWINKCYMLAFDSYEGKAGRLGMMPFYINKPKSNSFENWIDKKTSFAFVDFKNSPNASFDKNEPFFMKGLTHFNFKQPWASIFDGIFFIRDMYPCNR